MRRSATTASVVVRPFSSPGRLGVLRLGANCYEQRVPELIWDAPEEHKRAFLSGLWQGDGSWSRVNRGASVVLDATASRDSLTACCGCSAIWESWGG